jgi:tRNA dimethylallyltransferase
MRDVIIITGPTASGKTALSHLLAKNTGGQIIAADSMKVYRDVDIGTSKPPRSYQQEVKYHLIDIVEPTRRYDVGSFYRDACILIDGMHNKNILPIVTGGTSLYIAKLMEGLAEIPGIPEEMKKELEKKPVKILYDDLKKVDPKRAEQLHPNMKKRIVRAIGVYEITKKKMSELLLCTKPPNYNFILLGISWKREVLYERINKRVDKMIEAGLVEEVKNLYSLYGGEAPVFEGVGYQQLLTYLKGDMELKQAIGDIKQATRNYAKSQMTWWRNRKVIWLDGKKLSLN